MIEQETCQNVNNMNIGAKRGAALVLLIENFCEKEAWSIREFARRAGIRHSTISAWKKSDVVPDTRSLTKIAEVMGMELPDLWAKLQPSTEAYISLPDMLKAIDNMPLSDVAKIVSIGAQKLAQVS